MILTHINFILPILHTVVVVHVHMYYKRNLTSMCPLVLRVLFFLQRAVHYRVQMHFSIILINLFIQTSK